MNDINPLVSIVTPSYNQGSFLEATIQSVIGQSYPKIEYILVDGGSTDGSLDIIQKYRDQLAYWISEPDRGQAHAINKGIERSTGRILGWLNSDDVLAPDAVERIVARFASSPPVDVVYGFVDRIDAQGNPLRTPPSYYEQPVFRRELAIGECLVSQPGAFWRREALEAVGMLNEDWHHILDYDFWVRLAFAGARFDRLPLPPLAQFRLSAETKTVALLHQSGLENLSILDAMQADPNLAEKAGLPPHQVNANLQRARTLAMLKLFQAYSNRAGNTGQAFLWLRRALQLNAIVTIRRYRLVASGLLKMLAVAIRNKPKSYIFL